MDRDRATAVLLERARSVPAGAGGFAAWSEPDGRWRLRPAGDWCSGYALGLRRLAAVPRPARGDASRAGRGDTDRAGGRRCGPGWPRWTSEAGRGARSGGSAGTSGRSSPTCWPATRRRPPRWSRRRGRWPRTCTRRPGSCRWTRCRPSGCAPALDTSAAAVTAAALVRLAALDPAYRPAAERTVDALCSRVDGIGLQDGCYHRRTGLAPAHELVWGDFHLLEALLMLSGALEPLAF